MFVCQISWNPEHFLRSYSQKIIKILTQKLVLFFSWFFRNNSVKNGQNSRKFGIQTYLKVMHLFCLNKIFQNLKFQNLEQNFKIFCRNWWRFFNKSCPLWCREYENNFRFLGELSWVCHDQGLAVNMLVWRQQQRALFTCTGSSCLNAKKAPQFQFMSF